MRLSLEEFKGYLLLKGFTYGNSFSSLRSPDNLMHFNFNADGTINYIAYYFPLYERTFVEYRNRKDNLLFNATVLTNDTYDVTILVITFLTKSSYFDVFSNKILAKSIDDETIFQIYLHSRELAHYEQNGELTVIL